MRHWRNNPVRVLRIAILVVFFSVTSSAFSTHEALAAKSSSLGSACIPPTKMAASPQETAWEIWVAATCPVNQAQYPYVVWENWIQQPNMYPLNPTQGLTVPNAGQTATPHALGPSGLGTLNGLPTDPNTGCTVATDGQVICEEVRLNGAAEDYVSANGLWNRTAQQQAATAQTTIKFPKNAVEIKADWVLMGSSCSNQPSGLHLEEVGGSCYAMAAMHVISKLRGNWLWATFEAQNLTTNPNRCVVLGCKDPWGSAPARTNGANTQLTKQLADLMARANLAPEWSNYRLDGVQTRFVDANGKPTLLGNSVIEGENAGVPLQQSSCITCHSFSAINQDGTDGITLVPNPTPIGPEQALPSTAWIRRDFVWSLVEACFNSPFQSCPSVTSLTH